MKELRADFPFLTNRPELTYLDNAATTQRPQAVINALEQFYAYDNAPVHRGVYSLAEQATEAYENARVTVAQYLGVDPVEIVFTKGTTESINFVAQAWALHALEPDDEIVLSELEHHANILAWQRLAHQKNIKLVYIPITADGDLDYQRYIQLLTVKTKLIAITACSNAIGTQVNLDFIIQHARNNNIKILVDGAQVAGRQALDLHALGVDFFACSAHKMLGPTGIGVLYIKKQLHEQVEPYQVGGGMVANVNFDSATWLAAPQKYEAGTPAIAAALAYEAAVKYLTTHVDFAILHAHEVALTGFLLDALQMLPNIRLLGPQENLRMWGHMVSFVSPVYHAHDIAAYLDQFNICVRAGNQCAQPLHKKLGITNSVRISFYCYTTHQEVERCAYYITKLLA